MRSRVTASVLFLMGSYLVMKSLESLEFGLGNFCLESWYLIIPLLIIWFVEPVTKWLDELLNFLKD